MHTLKATAGEGGSGLQEERTCRAAHWAWRKEGARPLNLNVSRVYAGICACAVKSLMNIALVLPWEQWKRTFRLDTEFVWVQKLCFALK